MNAIYCSVCKKYMYNIDSGYKISGQLHFCSDECKNNYDVDAKVSKILYKMQQDNEAKMSLNIPKCPKCGSNSHGSSRNYFGSEIWCNDCKFIIRDRFFYPTMSAPPWNKYEPKPKFESYDDTIREAMKNLDFRIGKNMRDLLRKFADKFNEVKKEKNISFEKLLILSDITATELRYCLNIIAGEPKLGSILRVADVLGVKFKVNFK